MSSDVRMVPIGQFGAADLVSSPTGVIPSKVRAAQVERLSWTADLRHVTPPVSGEIAAAAVATSPQTTMHVATDPAGFPCLVRRCAKGAASAFAAEHRLGAAHLDGVSVPEVVAVAGTDVWMDRWPWEPSQGWADDGAVDAYVTSVLGQLFGSGVLVGTGAVHRSTSGRFVCEDVVVACQLESDQRQLLGSIVLALAAVDPVGVTDAAAELCRLRPARLARTATTAARSLEARWTAVAFGLAIHGIGRSVLSAGRRAEPLVLLGDELLHRLDLAHEHRVGVSGLADPRRVADLASTPRLGP